AVDTELDHQAFYKASRELEKLRAKAAANFESVTSTPTTTLASNEGAYNNLYSLKSDVLDVDPCTKQVTTTISWQVDASRPQKAQLTSVLTSPATLLAMGGGGCSASPPVDWSSPGTLGSWPGESGIIATDIAVKRGIVFLTSRPSSVSKPDFFIIDARNPGSPLLLNDPAFDTGPGLNAVAVAGNYAFAANNDSAHQLEVIDISDTAHPALVTSSTLRNGTTKPGNAIFYYGSRVYIGTQADGSGSEFQVYDVSDPAHPAWLGEREIGSDVNAIFVRGNFAYLATGDNNQEMKVLNV